MTNSSSNTDLLHAEGVVNKADLSEEHIKAIDSLSAEEIEQIKSIHKSANKDSDKPVGVFI